jgi:hypothetical protein
MIGKLTLIATFVATSQQYWNSKSPLGTDFISGQEYMSCDTIHDCFNCTLSNCQWGQNSCFNPLDGEQKGPTSFEHMLSQGRQCGDPLGACEQRMAPKTCESKETCPVQNEMFDRMEYGYSNHLDGQILPKGYFCLFSFDNVNEDGYWQYFNRTINQMSSTESVFLHDYYYSNAKNNRGWKNLYMKNEELDRNMNFSPLGAWPMTSGVKTRDIGWINTVTREFRADELNFQFDQFTASTS